jgi:hypothetical protein
MRIDKPEVDKLTMSFSRSSFCWRPILRWNITRVTTQNSNLQKLKRNVEIEMKREFKIFIIIFQKHIIFYTLANVELISKTFLNHVQTNFLVMCRDGLK